MGITSWDSSVTHCKPATWICLQLVQALNEDMRQRGFTWPDQITRPGPFLAQRLRHLPSRPPADRPRPVTTTANDGDPCHSPAPRPPAEPSPARLEAQRSIRETLSRALRRDVKA